MVPHYRIVLGVEKESLPLLRVFAKVPVHRREDRPKFPSNGVTVALQSRTETGRDLDTQRIQIHENQAYNTGMHANT